MQQHKRARKCEKRGEKRCSRTAANPPPRPSPRRSANGSDDSESDPSFPKRQTTSCSAHGFAASTSKLSAIRLKSSPCLRPPTLDFGKRERMKTRLPVAVIATRRFLASSKK